jgi:hypothetical protein
MHLFHRWQPWRIIVSVPLWRSNEYSSTTKTCAGNQPLKYYPVSNGTSKLFADQDYKLIGKIIEQSRQCSTCNLTQFKWDRVTV